MERVTLPSIGGHLGQQLDAAKECIRPRVKAHKREWVHSRHPKSNPISKARTNRALNRAVKPLAATMPKTYIPSDNVRIKEQSIFTRDKEGKKIIRPNTEFVNDRFTMSLLTQERKAIAKEKARIHSRHNKLIDKLAKLKLENEKLRVLV